MELHKLHVLHGALGAVHHGLAVAGGYHGIGGGLVHGAAAAGAHERHLAQVSVHFLRVGVEHIGAVALYVGGASCHLDAQVVLGDDFHGEVVFLDRNVGIGTYGGHQSALYLRAGVVGVVQDAEL